MTSVEQDVQKLAIDMTDQQKNKLLKLINKKTNEATQAERQKAAASASQVIQNAVTADKTAADLIKYGTAASRRPDIFDPTATAITDFVDEYESYIQILGLKGVTAVRAFLTYLTPRFQNQVREAGLGENDNWEDFKEKVVPLIQSLNNESKLIARLKLQKAKQEPGESMMDFGERLRKFGKSGYPARCEEPLREVVLKQALSMGVLQDEIGVQLLQEAFEEISFTDLLQSAAQLEIAYTAREVARVEPFLNVLAAERGSNQCWSCEQHGHYQRDCRAFNNYDLPHQNISSGAGCDEYRGAPQDGPYFTNYQDQWDSGPRPVNNQPFREEDFERRNNHDERNRKN
eukprot:sb/3466341/